MSWFRYALFSLLFLLLTSIGVASLYPAPRGELLPNYELKPEPERLELNAIPGAITETQFVDFEKFADVAYGPHPTHHRMDVYVPRSEETQLPLVAYIHAEGTDKGDSPSAIASTLLQGGFAVAQIDYRPTKVRLSRVDGKQESHDFPAQIEDCKTAVRFLRANASKYGLDSNRIGALGPSMGGYLAALLCTTSDARLFENGDHLDQSSSVQAACSWNGVTDFRTLGHEQDYHAECLAAISPLGNPSIFSAGYARGKLTIAARASPITYATSDDPPILLVAGFNDVVVPPHQANAFYARLRNVGCEAEIHIVVGGDHTGATIDNAETHERTLDFFDRKLRRTNR